MDPRPQDKGTFRTSSSIHFSKYASEVRALRDNTCLRRKTSFRGNSRSSRASGRFIFPDLISDATRKRGSIEIPKPSRYLRRLGFNFSVFKQENLMRELIQGGIMRSEK